MPEPRDIAEGLEAGAELPKGADESFLGYGVMGLPFASGDCLCMRRFPASSVGPAYTSVWHRDAEGRWTFYQNEAPQQSCPRYFGSAIAGAFVREIELSWTGPRSFSISVSGEGGLDWQVSLGSTAATRAMNVMASLIPGTLWRNHRMLRLMGAMASLTLGAGRLGLAGRVPNGQGFIANPRTVWAIPSSRALVGGRELGSVGALPVQAKLGDFWIPQRGLFAIGGAFFEPFDSARHLSATSVAETA